MNTEKTDITSGNGILFYDGQCRFCRSLAAHCGSLLRSRGFHLEPLQASGAAERLHLDSASLLAEMRLLTRDGAALGGADAVVHLARFIWWAKPIRFIAWLPGGLALLRCGYRWVAARRGCAAGACGNPRSPDWIAWAALPALPVLAAVATARAEPWLFMWAMAGAIFFGCKWLTLREGVAVLGEVPLARSLAYLFLWPGMDARAFLDTRKRPRTPALDEWVLAAAKTAFGAFLLWAAARHLPGNRPLLVGWTGMLGLIFLLHFGAFHIVALIWRGRGVAAEPIMRMPVAARSLVEFWGVRWNRGFNDLAERHLFQPARRGIGVSGATLLVFLASGLIHELVISVPARGGYGFPTLYFLIQGFGVLLERSSFGRKAGLRRGLRGRLFALIFTAAPVWWLFHPPFVERVFLPFMQAIKAI